MRKSDANYSENLFRPIYEINTAASWAVGGVATPLLSASYTGASTLLTSVALGVGMVLYGTKQFLDATPMMRKQMALTTNKKVFMTTKELRELNNLKARFAGTDKEREKDEGRTFFGNGFEWGSEHANRAYQVMDMHSDMAQVQLPIFLKPFAKAASRETEELGGKPWIHGLGSEVRQMILAQNWYGHSLIAGNVGTGKTTLLRLMSLNAIHLNNVLIVLDPKNDEDWKQTIKAELEYLGMGDRFYHLHPAKASSSCRIPLLKNYTRLTEIADRIAPLMGGSGSGKAFQDFAYDIIYKTAFALEYLGEPIRLTRIARVVSSDRKGLALKVFRKFFDETLGAGWHERLSDVLSSFSPDPLEAMAMYYNQNLASEHQSKVIEAMISFALHEQAHYSKMVVSLNPILTRLTADPLDDLFSPVDDPDSDDERPVVDLEDVMERGGCIYISLDSLTDGTTAGDVSKIVLAEIAAVAGRRYNSGDKSARRVTVANDEVHASLEGNDALLNILAQGRAAAMEMILATQTVSDLIGKTDDATAKRFLGLCNNFVTMRTTDPETQRYASEQFSKASVSSNEVRQGTFTDTSSSLMSFSAGYQETQRKMREDAFPTNLFGDLPVLQFVARLADGKRLKMRLPVVLSDNDEEPAEWAQREVA